ncbi:nucleoside recognition domain-containing protein, partial [uncultured Helicobacter sp.]
KKAGTYILLASVIIWVGTQFPKNPALEAQMSQSVETLEERMEEANDEEREALQEQIDEIEHNYQAALVEQSYLGRIGQFIQPVFIPMDFDWKLSVSLLNGLLAKEMIISSMGVLYALGNDIDENNDMPLRDILREYISLPTAIAFILFIMFYNPCFASSIVFGKEAGGKRYIAYLFLFTSVVSYIFALVGYNIARWIVE